MHRAIAALNLLIPGQNKESVIKWYEGKITLEILGKHRIIGIDNKWLAQSRESIWEWISVLDMDKNTFYGPGYIMQAEKKCILKDMIASRRCFLTQDSSSCFFIQLLSRSNDLTRPRYLMRIFFYSFCYWKSAMKIFFS